MTNKPFGKRLSALHTPSAQGGSSPSDNEGWLARLALSRSLSLSEKLSPEVLLEMGHSAEAWAELALEELTIARHFNKRLASEPSTALLSLKTTVCELLKAEEALFLWLDETSATYRCLNDELIPAGNLTQDVAPRELTHLADHFLQELLGTPHLMHSYLMADDQLLGLVVVGRQAKAKPFTPAEQVRLELISPYLSTQLLVLQTLKASYEQPFVQQVVLHMSEYLITTAQKEVMLSGILEQLCHHLEFQVGQYVTLEPQTGEGQVLCEFRQIGKHGSLRQAGKHPHRLIKDFASLVSLFRSGAWSGHYLHLKTPYLGDKPLAQLFGVAGIQSALVLPVFSGGNTEQGDLCGAFCLLRTQTGSYLPKTSFEIATQTTRLMGKALGRTLVLEKALALATSDELTGLMNRRGFYERFELELERCRRSGAPMALAMLDVDHFKTLNDTYGHLAGDVVLKALGELLLQNVRKTDAVCRYGGEEFVLLLPGTSQGAALELLERMREHVAGMVIPSPAEQIPLGITISAGLTMVNLTLEGDSEPTPLADWKSEDWSLCMGRAISQADDALYRAKHHGRNQVCLLPEEFLD